MSTFAWVVAIVFGIGLFYAFLRKKPQPVQETLYNFPPGRAKHTVDRRPAPRTVVYDAKGNRYSPYKNGTYQNTETNQVVTWLMLYVLLSEAERASFEPPTEYADGMTPWVAEELSQQELINVGHGDNLLTSPMDEIPSQKPLRQEDPPSAPYYVHVDTNSGSHPERESGTHSASSVTHEPAPSVQAPDPTPSYSPPDPSPSPSASFDSGSSNF